MPYGKLSEAPANIRELDDVALTLAQVNWIANVAEGLDPDKVKNVWAVAIGQFKKSFVKREGKWVKREQEEKGMSISESVRSLTKWLLGDDDEFGKWSPAILSPKEVEAETKDLSLYDISSMIQDRVAPLPLETVVREDRAWVEAIYPDTKKGYVIIKKAGGLYRADYAIGEDGEMELSEATKVEVTYEAKSLEAVDAGIKVFDFQGKPYWAAMTSNAFKDLEEETISTKVLEDYVAAVDAGEISPNFLARLKEWGLPTTPQGELWYAHIPYSRIGEPVWKGVHEHFLLEVGTFDDTPFAQAMAQALKTEGNACQTSHGYLHEAGDREDGIYKKPIWKYETSVLPRAITPANPWTSFQILKEDKEMNETQRAALVGLIGEEQASALLEAAETKAEELKAAGISFKALDETKEETKVEPGEEVAPKSEEATEAVFAKDSEAFKFLIEKVAEALAPENYATKDALEELVAEVKAIREADKPWAIMDRKSWNRPSEDPDNVGEGEDTETKTPSDTIRDKMKHPIR